MPISPRFASVHLKGATGNLAVLAVQVRAFDAEEEAKDSFYDDPKAAIDSAPTENRLIVEGGWNVRPGPTDMATW